jgi:hypothetical protein
MKNQKKVKVEFLRKRFLITLLVITAAAFGLYLVDPFLVLLVGLALGMSVLMGTAITLGILPVILEVSFVNIFFREVRK